MSNFRQCDRETPYLLPPSVDEWLPPDHLARFVVDIVERQSRCQSLPFASHPYADMQRHRRGSDTASTDPDGPQTITVGLPTLPSPNCQIGKRQALTPSRTLRSMTAEWIAKTQALKFSRRPARGLS